MLREEGAGSAAHVRNLGARAAPGELLVFVDAENLAFSDFNVKVDEKNLKLKAICKGEKMNRSKHETRTHVKAATYHRMKIENKNGVWEAQVILDI